MPNEAASVLVATQAICNFKRLNFHDKIVHINFSMPENASQQWPAKKAKCMKVKKKRIIEKRVKWQWSGGMVSEIIYERIYDGHGTIFTHNNNNCVCLIAELAVRNLLFIFQLRKMSEKKNVVRRIGNEFRIVGILTKSEMGASYVLHHRTNTHSPCTRTADSSHNSSTAQKLIGATERTKQMYICSQSFGDTTILHREYRKLNTVVILVALPER